MKTVSIILLLTLTGCATMEKALFVEEQTVNPQTQQVETVLKPAPIVEAAVKASGALPIPYLETGLSVLLAGAGAYLTRLRKQKKTLEGVTAAVIAGVEAFSKTDDGEQVAKKLKGKITETAVYIGYDKELHDKVQKVVNSGSNT